MTISPATAASAAPITNAAEITTLRRWDAFCRHRDAVGKELERIKSCWVDPKVAGAQAERILGQPLERECALVELLRRPGVTYAELMTLPGAGAAVTDIRVADQVEIATKYAGYIERQHDEVSRNAAQEGRALPGNLD